MNAAVNDKNALGPNSNNENQPVNVSNGFMSATPINSGAFDHRNTSNFQGSGINFGQPPQQTNNNNEGFSFHHHDSRLTNQSGSGFGSPKWVTFGGCFFNSRDFINIKLLRCMRIENTHVHLYSIVKKDKYGNNDIAEFREGLTVNCVDFDNAVHKQLIEELK